MTTTDEKGFGPFFVDLWGITRSEWFRWIFADAKNGYVVPRIEPDGQAIRLAPWGFQRLPGAGLWTRLA